jgi:hypothetical protein
MHLKKQTAEKLAKMQAHKSTPSLHEHKSNELVNDLHVSRIGKVQGQGRGF